MTEVLSQSLAQIKMNKSIALFAIGWVVTVLSVIGAVLSGNGILLVVSVILSVLGVLSIHDAVVNIQSADEPEEKRKCNCNYRIIPDPAGMRKPKKTE